MSEEPLLTVKRPWRIEAAGNLGGAKDDSACCILAADDTVLLRMPNQGFDVLIAEMIVNAVNTHYNAYKVATIEHIAKAQLKYACDDIKFERVARAKDGVGGTWVEGWFWIEKDEQHEKE